MIREFSAKAKASNNKARTLFALCMALSFVFLSASTLLPLYRGVVSLIGLGLLVAAITIFTKYVSPIFYYDITFDSEGAPLFVVRQMIGKRQTTLCRIGLFEIVKIEKENSEQRKAHKTPTGFVKYSYIPTIMPETTYRITSVNRYEKSEILIEASDEFISILRVYSAEARGNYIPYEEE